MYISINNWIISYSIVGHSRIYFIYCFTLQYSIYKIKLLGYHRNYILNFHSQKKLTKFNEKINNHQKKNSPIAGNFPSLRLNLFANIFLFF